MKIITRTAKDTSWAEVKAAADNGTILSGDLISFNLKNGEEVAVRATRDERGKLFFVLEDCLDEEHFMNMFPEIKKCWAGCDMREYLNKTVFEILPDELQAIIAPTKIVQNVDDERVETEDKLFLLSATQVFGKADWSDQEPEDTQLDCFLREKDRVKERGYNGTWIWWLRSAIGGNYFDCVSPGGSYDSEDADKFYGVVFGFCLKSE